MIDKYNSIYVKSARWWFNTHTPCGILTTGEINTLNVLLTFFVMPHEVILSLSIDTHTEEPENEPSTLLTVVTFPGAENLREYLFWDYWTLVNIILLECIHVLLVEIWILIYIFKFTVIKSK